MTKYILTDVDDTCLKFADPFQDWLREHKGMAGHGRLLHSYDVAKWLGITDEKATDLIVEYIESGHLDDQPPEPCALEIIPRFRQMGYEFVAITACGTNPAFAERRRKRLEDVFGFTWANVHCVPLGGHKDAFLSLYAPSIWVEDNWSHAVTGQALGHRSFIVTRGYNDHSDHPEITRVDDWFGIMQTIALPLAS
jgi:hypothetical protein